VIDLDDHLVAIAAGDARAFARWLAGAEPALRAGLRRFAAQVDVEAVLQEALLRTWTLARRVTPDGRPNALLRYAATIAHRLAIDETRRLARRPTEALEHEPAVPAPQLPDPRLAATIRACLDALPPAPGRALGQRLDAAGGVHDRELAEAVGMSLNTFLKNVGRARALLLDCLGRHGVRLEAP
jgi:RNA polymerase sigma-70 factor (ECF subfamily)